jgi:hypothetical protein
MAFARPIMAQPKLDTAALNRQLAEIYERDQGPRQSGEYKKVRVNDSINLAAINGIIDKYGWLGKSVIGSRGNFTLWIVIQHAPLDVEQKYLPLLEKSVADSESRPVDLAYLKDRVLMYEGKKQIYGTQAKLGKASQIMEIWPIEDDAHVNERRAKVGLSTVEEYAKQLDAVYAPGKELEK